MAATAKANPLAEFAVAIQKDPFEPFWDFLKPHYEMVMAAEMTVGERIQCILLVKVLDEMVSARGGPKKKKKGGRPARPTRAPQTPQAD